MKILPFLAIAALFSGHLFAEEAKPAEASADALWAAIEPLLKGPAEQPKSQQEAEVIFTKHLKLVDEKAEAFLKAFPNDGRRWKVTLHDIQANSARAALKIKPKTKEELEGLVTAILDAPDADKAVKAFASFMRVIEAEGDQEAFAKLAASHLKDYPDFERNKQIEVELKNAALEVELKAKPLELKFTATNGQEVDLAKLRGKVVLVDFWATWCGPCIAELPNVLAAYEKLHDKGFEIVGISFDQDKAALEKLTKERNMTWVQYFDGKGWDNELGKKYGISAIPRMWLLDKKGMVVDTSARENLAEKVEKLLAE